MPIIETTKSHFLEQFEQHIDAVLTWDEQVSHSAEPTLFAAARHLCLAKGGKRARPKLVYFFAKGLGLFQSEVLDIAVTAEFIHNASLLHDDVIDNGELRRGQPTVNVVWDSLTAVLAGDILLSESIRILKDCPRVVATEALELVSIMTRATMMEAHVRNNTNVSIDQWDYIADGKTSSMFTWCGRAIGHLADNQDAVECFGKFGHHFGLAFQIADDVLDIQHNSSGKTPFADLRNKNPSFPIVLACQQSPLFKRDLEHAWMQDVPSEESIMKLGNKLIDMGIVTQCIDRIQREVDLSIQALGDYADKPGCQEIAQWALAMCHRFQVLESA
jgi:heptaprenyl diphosphate synthase